jgi:hypothetical protein
VSKMLFRVDRDDLMGKVEMEGLEAQRGATERGVKSSMAFQLPALAS